MVGTAVAVVTGANSFIATEIVAQLLHKGYTVRATVRDTSDPSKTAHLNKLAEAFPGELTFHEAHLGTPHAFHEIIKGAAYVYHCAAHLDMELFKMGIEVRRSMVAEAVQSQMDIIHVVRTGSFSVQAAAASKNTVKRIVITSSMAAVKPFDAIRQTPWNEEDWNVLSEEQMENNTYHYIKTLTEKKSFELAEELDISLSSVVPSFVIGPVISNHKSFSSHIIKCMVEEGSGNPSWLATAVDVRDVARTHILAAEKPGPGGRYLVARSHPLPPGVIIDNMRAALPEYKIDDKNKARQGFYNPNFHIFDTSKLSVESMISMGNEYGPTGCRSRMVAQVERELGLKFTDVQESFKDMIFSMIMKGMIDLELFERDDAESPLQEMKPTADTMAPAPKQIKA